MWRTIVHHPTLIEKQIDYNRHRENPTTVEIVAAKNTAKEKYQAMCFLLSADKERFGKLIQDLKNTYSRGYDKLPSNLTEGRNILIMWKQDAWNTGRSVVKGIGITLVSSRHI